MGNSIGEIALELVVNSSNFAKQVSGLKRIAQGAGKSISSSFSGVGNSIENTGKKIAGALAGAFAVTQIVDFGKKCLELGSDLQEVQNVVDVAFPHMTDQVDRFAKSAAQSFGLSETMAKRYTGTFGAMAKAFGFTEAQAYDMSVMLAGLAGDVASFYNITQDEAYTKLKSVFTGETETLKDLGVVMTQAALDQYALANGYGKTTQAMTEQEKVALRYAFVQQQLSAAQGDFARTSDSWANQTRVASLQLQSIMATIGQGLINLFTPAIKLINVLLGKIATLANSFKAFTEFLAGGNSGSGSVAAPISELSSAADMANSGLVDTSGAADNLADSAKGVGTAAKKAARDMKSLMGFDQINKLDSPVASGDSGGSAGAGPGDLSEIGPIGNFDFGTLQTGDAAEQIVGEFTSELMDLIAAQDWAGIGKYFAEKINEGIRIATDLISWENLGPKITGFVTALTEGLNSLVSHLDFHAIGVFLGTGFNTVLYTLLLAITGFDWKTLGAQLANGLNGLVDTIDWAALGQLIGSRLMIPWNMLLGFVQTLNWGEIGTSISEALNNVLRSFDLGVVAEALASLVNGLSEALFNAAATFDWTYLGIWIYDGINTLISTIDWGNVAASISAALVGLLESIVLAAKGIDWAQIGYAIWDFIANIDWAGLLSGIFGILEQLILGAVETLLGFLQGVWDSICAIFAPLAEWFGGLFSDAWEWIKGAWASVTEWFGDIWTGIKEVFSGVGGWFSDIFSGAWDGITDAWSSVTGFFGDIWKGIQNTFGKVKDWFKDKFSAAWQAVKDVFSTGGKIFDGIKDGILNGLKTVINAIIRGINKVIAVPFNGINSALRAIKKVSILGFKPFDWLGEIGVPQIPELATGGYVKPNTPQLAMIGDNRHQGEVVAPEDKLLEMAKMAAAASGQNVPVSELVSLLRQILDYLKNHELVEIDPEAMRKWFIRKTNQKTKETGVCEILT